jgi:type 1 glutamine amidotransferase
VSRFAVLVYCRAEGFVHASIPAAVSAIERLGERHDFAVHTTDDPASLVDELGGHDATVFVHTSGNVLPASSQRDSLERYVRGGGGFFGIHAASAMGDLDIDWPFYRELVGATFKGHTVARIYSDEPVSGAGVVWAGPLAEAPPDAEPIGPTIFMSSCERARVRVEVPTSPAGRGLVDGELRNDEWYGFDESPRGRVEVVATVDESTYRPAMGTMGSDHPIVWWQRVGDGRSVYNAMGHASTTWLEESFLESIVGGIELAAGAVPSHEPVVH